MEKTLAGTTSWLRKLTEQLQQRLESIKKGGGEKAIQKQREKNKLTARERVAYLCDADKPFIEIGAFAGYEMYEEYGGCPAGGTVAGIGYVSGRQCVIMANDQTVKAGAWFPITGKKNLRMQEIAIENNLPLIYLVDSAGVFLPLQDEIFPDKEHFGRIFRNNAQISAMGITQIAAVMGSCVAGGAYLPVMSDEILIVRNNGSIFLAGPYLVKAAIGEETDMESLGGASMHAQISGTADYIFDTEHECLDHIKKLVAQIADSPKANFNRIQSFAPAKDPEELYGLLSDGNARPYNVVDIIDRIVDADIDEPSKSSFRQFKEEYGKTIVCGYGRIDGWSVGFVANQRLIVKNGEGEMQVGGVIYNDSADKAARFILNCNQKKIPIIFLQDVTGFMVGRRSEHAGIIKDGAKMVNAVANSVVPKFTIVTGNSFGAGYYAMCGKAYDPRLIVAWPSGKIAVMGGEQAARTLLQTQTSGKNLTKEEENALLQKIKDRYEKQTTPYYAAARMWVDAIIDPVETRQLISEGISAANNNANMPEFKTGVIQV
ncbi:acyl-CoA carboxylase subunit beta [Danxiaibacter flavus]|uniref:Acyl-CoA carboxylase subunit beta n=1 Tax=Danxiaibacter flavus TaxID=3049108 RepID=A0ABV3ZP70_9BACT|nr:acyl-CoA carboxylase subunit beta [Chitinophagaceae bacterium DXS]